MDNLPRDIMAEICQYVPDEDAIYGLYLVNHKWHIVVDKIMRDRMKSIFDYMHIGKFIILKQIISTPHMINHKFIELRDKVATIDFDGILDNIKWWIGASKIFIVVVIIMLIWDYFR